MTASSEPGIFRPAPSAQATAAATLACRSCRGLLISYRSSAEPICLGLSSGASNIDLTKIHAARQLPENSSVAFVVAFGHAAHQPSSAQVPPGIVTGVELLRLELPPAEPASPADASKPVPFPPAVLSAASSAASFISSLRIMTSHESTNASIRRTVDALSNFNLTAYADKFKGQANKNVEAMRKWLKDLEEAVTKPKK